MPKLITETRALEWSDFDAHAVVMVPQAADVRTALTEALQGQFIDLVADDICLEDPHHLAAVFDRCRPDLVIVDAAYGCAKVNAVCAAVRSGPHTAGVPIMAVVDESDPAQVACALAACVDDILPLPFTSLLLLTRIRVLTRLAQNQKAESDHGYYRSLAEQAPVSILAVDPIGTITYANAAAHDMLGATERPLTGENLMAFIAAESGSTWVQTAQDVFTERTRYGSAVLGIVRTDHTQRSVHAGARLVRWNNGRGIVLTLTDVTQMQEAHAERDQERDLLQSLNSQIVTSHFAQRHQWTSEIQEKIASPLLALSKEIRSNGNRKASTLLRQLTEATLHVQRRIAPVLTEENDLTAMLTALLKQQTGTTTKLESEINDCTLDAGLASALYHFISDLLQTPEPESKVESAAVYLWHERDTLYAHIEYRGSDTQALDKLPAWNDIVALGGEIVMACEESDCRCVTIVAPTNGTKPTP